MDAQVLREAGTPGAKSPWGRHIKQRLSINAGPLFISQSVFSLFSNNYLSLKVQMHLSC